MPELPEVETMVRGVRPHVEGRTIASFRKCRCRCRPIVIAPLFHRISRRVNGTRIERVWRLAKRIVFDLSSTDRLAIEPRMTGLLLLCDPPDAGHLRLEWQFEPADGYGCDSMWFWDRRGLGTVRLYSESQFHSELGPTRLGRDALAMTPADWRSRCASTSRPIKVALLDQSLVAGIGNLYASEILFAARIHPARPASSLLPRQVARLSQAVRQILTDAIRDEGSTLGDGTYRNALSKDGRYQNEHRVYMKAGQTCGVCRRAAIVRIVQAQRSTFLCPRCQRASP